VETVRSHLTEIAAHQPGTLVSYVAMARATANRAVVDGRLLPIRAVKIVRLLDEALEKVERPTASRPHEQVRRDWTDRS
jgi:hypothetical protein